MRTFKAQTISTATYIGESICLKAHKGRQCITLIIFPLFIYSYQLLTSLVREWQKTNTHNKRTPTCAQSRLPPLQLQPPPHLPMCVLITGFPAPPVLPGSGSASLSAGACCRGHCFSGAAACRCRLSVPSPHAAALRHDPATSGSVTLCSADPPSACSSWHQFLERNVECSGVRWWCWRCCGGKVHGGRAVSYLQDSSNRSNKCFFLLVLNE